MRNARRARAIRLDGLIRSGEVTDQAALARLGMVTRARMTQIMGLRNVAPDIQEQLLFLPAVAKSARLSPNEACGQSWPSWIGRCKENCGGGCVVLPSPLSRTTPGQHLSQRRHDEQQPSGRFRHFAARVHTRTVAGPAYPLARLSPSAPNWRRHAGVSHIATCYVSILRNLRVYLRSFAIG